MSDPVADLKRELLAAAERRHRRALPGHARILAIAAALTVAASAALFVTTPWHSSPGFLERAQAALTQPRGTIWHARWVERFSYASIFSNRTCTVTTSEEVWIDERTGRIRALLHNIWGPPYPRPPTPREVDKLACTNQRPYELGVSPGGTVFQFVPPNRVAPTIVGWSEDDPVPALRGSLAAGKARDLGLLERHGRTVRRICLLDELSACGVDYFVDPETFYPVEMDAGDGDITRWTAYEYLPRTAANLALTSIHAQHPGATG